LTIAVAEEKCLGLGNIFARFFGFRPKKQRSSNILPINKEQQTLSLRFFQHDTRGCGSCDWWGCGSCDWWGTQLSKVYTRSGWTFVHSPAGKSFAVNLLQPLY